MRENARLLDIMNGGTGDVAAQADGWSSMLWDQEGRLRFTHMHNGRRAAPQVNFVRGQDEGRGASTLLRFVSGRYQELLGRVRAFDEVQEEHVITRMHGDNDTRHLHHKLADIRRVIGEARGVRAIRDLDLFLDRIRVAAEKAVEVEDGLQGLHRSQVDSLENTYETSRDVRDASIAVGVTAASAGTGTVASAVIAGTGVVVAQSIDVGVRWSSGEPIDWAAEGRSLSIDLALALFGGPLADAVAGRVLTNTNLGRSLVNRLGRDTAKLVIKTFVSSSGGAAVETLREAVAANERPTLSQFLSNYARAFASNVLDEILDQFIENNFTDARFFSNSTQEIAPQRRWRHIAR
ncbi:MAG: hypothetical protein EA397_14870 [Deltaproteobacteria bacterium]|nr:MAG: hypothetical protein EA397_14870 [Deltaproteobacteria bacterium]